MDEDAMRGGLLRALLACGFQVVTASDSGLMSRPDEEHLTYASNAAAVLYTFNVGDFRRLHNEWICAGRHHAGIILAPQQRYSVGEQMRRIMRLSAVRSAEQMRNRVEFLGNWG
jgi:hypothetical protein